MEIFPFESMVLCDRWTVTRQIQGCSAFYFLCHFWWRSRFALSFIDSHLRQFKVGATASGGGAMTCKQDGKWDCWGTAGATCSFQVELPVRAANSGSPVTPRNRCPATAVIRRRRSPHSVTHKEYGLAAQVIASNRHAWRAQGADCAGDLIPLQAGACRNMSVVRPLGRSHHRTSKTLTF
jgi:hypothetical protein